MKQILITILFIITVFTSRAQVHFAGTAITTEVINDSVLNTTVSVPTSAFTSNLIAVAVTEYQHSYPVKVIDVYSQKVFKAAQSVVTKNGSLLTMYYLADAANGTHKIRVSTGKGNTTNIQTVTSAYTGVDLNAPIAFTGGNINNTPGNIATLDIACATDQLVVKAMVFEKAVNPEAAPLPGSNLSYINRNSYNLESSSVTNLSGKINLTWDLSKEIAGYWGAVALTLQPTRYAIVPGQLINFSGKPENDRVELSWITTFENNLSYIAVMRSADNKEWKEVTGLTISGNSPVQKVYNVVDKNVGNGSYYYRLVFISGDGKKATSQIINIKSAADKKLRFANMQNPFFNDMHIALYTATETNVVIKVLNSRGILICTKTMKAENGAIDFNLQQTAGLAPGIYFVQCNSETEMITKTMVKH